MRRHKIQRGEWFCMSRMAVAFRNLGLLLVYKAATVAQNLVRHCEDFVLLREIPEGNNLYVQ